MSAQAENWQNGSVANTSLTPRRWFPQNQPQTLQIAVALLYWNAVLSLLFSLFTGGTGRYGLILVLLEVFGGLGVANEKKWGYWVAIVAAIVPFAFLALGYTGASIISILFEIALVVALVHPMSRSYYKIWFR
jgi:hypothetical protein